MTPFFPFSWKELLDLLLISFLLHRLYLLFRGTTALQVAIGFFFLWLLYFGAERAGLVLTTRFFQAMAAVAAIALIIVFRREIRSVLLHTNPLRFFLGQPASPAQIDPEEAASVAFHLADEKVGGLICLQRRHNVEEFVQEGTELDGRFGAAIIQSIFSKESPVHDGAVVVRDGRITRIGGFLPLSNEKNLPERLGTRHRAALGLSERCDAVILVVSEERGEVSLVHRGRLETFKSLPALRLRLRELLGKPEASFSRKNLSVEGLRQVGGLAVAFLMVSVLWNLYLGAGHSLISLRVPVEFRNVPENTVVTHDFEEHFVVRISGKNPLVEALRPAQVSAFIDLAGLPTGSHTLTIKEDNIRLPPGLEIEQILPGNVEIHMEPRISRDVPVKVVLKEDGWNADSGTSFTTEPATIRVTGPKSRVERLTRLETVPLSLRKLDLEDGANFTGRLGPLPPFISLGEGVDREVRIGVEREL